MLRPDPALAGLLVDLRPRESLAIDQIRTEFYREEFLKHRDCLRRLRDAYSDCTITEMEAALCHVMARVDELCAKGGGDLDRVVSGLLRSFDGVTKLSAWSDPPVTH
ncbi:MAG: hypothetical protein OXG35_10865 [Acidobacteria bacterium]|nr:hypothetical protein [Acidobacteriota bacterium]